MNHPGATDPIQFEFEWQTPRTVFGRGITRSSLETEISRLGAERVMLIVTESEAELGRDLVAPFSERVKTIFTEVSPHVPSDVA